MQTQEQWPVADIPERKTLLQTAQAAAYLHISPRTLEDYRIKGGGPVFIRLGLGKRSPVLYDLADLNAWLDSRKVAATFEES
ncbi:protein of unknown function [Candidatus Filomicrobium marinum]|uniref:Helix-turn-helix domain-containing protein n=1 Tax=Candidatus Filomicrobium marinum TaxID=1608628 RepID=A0A0D6JKC0_9HYPH|nr:helix-turn-helix domain-containing protein [Candidatus Filomicrobium marinum]MCV0370753.1 helix-turn-helix domain-containing protein [Filomicrobium sp.]CFX30122.1 protein of unknown function [Candidatus Filomicrobium marinum]CPR22105.1 protein of unknown function [Candidatus Filomicrobium marinum]